MRTFLAITIAAILFYSCEKSSTGPEDEIYVFSIDKVVTLNKPDSLSLGGCSPILFDINKNSENEFEASIRFAVNYSTCVGGAIIKFMLNEEGKVAALKEGNVINEKGTWGYANDLEYFAGKGEMYIGIKDYAMPEEETSRRFSWIKINLTKNMDTLYIINKGINLTINNHIKAGQTE